MKQKYMIEKGDNKTDLIIREFAELEKAEYSLLMEETYNLSTIQKAAEEGMEALMTAIKTHDLFPPHAMAEKIAEGITALLNDSERDSVEVAIDDANILKEEEAGLEEDIEPEEDIDELLEDDFSFDGDDDENEDEDSDDDSD